MAQTTNAISFKDAYIGFSTSGTTWVDASGETNTVSLSGGARNFGAAHTADGDTPILKGGKRNEETISINSIYTEDATGIVERATAAYEACTAFYIKIAPAGNSSGNEKFYNSSAGIVLNPTYPLNADASGGEPIAISVDVVVPFMVQATMTSTL